jgi:hypothetical protein
MKIPSLPNGCQDAPAQLRARNVIETFTRLTSKDLRGRRRRA